MDDGTPSPTPPRETPTVGFVSPPSWFDPGPAELAALMDHRVDVQQTILPLIDFGYAELDNLANAVPEMETCTRLLGVLPAATVTARGQALRASRRYLNRLGVA